LDFGVTGQDGACWLIAFGWCGRCHALAVIAVDPVCQRFSFASLRPVVKASEIIVAILLTGIIREVGEGMQLRIVRKYFTNV
jgi:hypothetical protein